MASRYSTVLPLALLASLLVTAAVGPAERAQARDVTRGKELYVRHCAGCHGVDGRGEAKTFRPNVGNLAVKDLMDQISDDYLFTVIQKGGAAVGKNAAMPGWNTQLGDDDIWDIVAFVRTLARR